MCSESESGALSYDKISFAKDSDRCTLEFKVYHNAGCGVVKASGLIQYLSSKPWLVSLILLAVGFVICFFGGKLIKLVYIALPAFLVFLFLANMVSSFGTFSVLEEDNETTWKGGAKALIGIIFCIRVAIYVGVFVKKWQTIISGILGGIAGFFLGFLLYSVVLAMFIKSTVILWLLIIMSSAGCTALMMKKKD